MATLTELTAEIVSAHASGSSLTSEELIKNIHAVYSTLKSLEAGETMPLAEPAPTEAPTALTTPILTIKQAFKNKDSVLCMICGKGFKTLKVHLSKAHDLKPTEYRKQFNIPSSQTLAAKSYVESRRQMALDKGLGAGLVKFRADKKAETDAKNKAVPMVKVKAPLPAVKVKAGVPAKIEVVKDTTSAKALKTLKTKSAPKTKK
jgi:predicted transcriptional regulator